jgi:hypothetical protein
MEEEELDDTIGELLAISPDDFITMAQALSDAFEGTGYGSGRIDADDEGRRRLTLHTGGWSDCEYIIGSIQDISERTNINLFWMMYWYQSTVGGHYVFIDRMKR